MISSVTVLSPALTASSEPAETPRGPPSRTRVLFVCVGNTGRSVMAERLLRRAAGDRFETSSAGSSPGDRIEDGVLEALAEVGIDASDHVPRRLGDGEIAWADVVVATCDEACPVIAGKRFFAWQIPDAYGLPVERVRAIRDEITRHVEALAAELDASA